MTEHVPAIVKADRHLDQANEADEHCPSKVNLGERGIDAHCQLRPGHVGLHGQDNVMWTDIDQSGHGEVYVDIWPVPNVVRELLDLPSSKRPGERP